MNSLFEAAKEICGFMAGRGWEFCIIGGLAVQRWGEPRTTLDADISLLSEWGEEDRYISDLLDRFESRIPEGHAFALTNRVLLLQATNGKAVDIALSALPFEVAMVRRAVPVEFAPELILPCCTAEDLFVLKAFAARPRDWLDVESIVARTPDLNTEHIISNLKDLCELKKAPEILERAKNILEEQT